MEFETVSAAIFGIFTIFKLIKTIIDIAAHGYQLRETYECGAICGPVTHPLLYLKRRRNIDDQTAQPQGISITQVVIQLPTTPAFALSKLRDTISQISYGNLNSKDGGVTSRAPHAP